MEPLHIDLETRSAADLKKVGAHRYAEDPTTSIICGSYRFGAGPVQRWRGEDVPLMVLEHVVSGAPVAGHNQQFERVVWNARVKLAVDGEPVRLKPEQQDCTMARAAAMGLPHSLDNLGAALNLTFQKDKAGHALMMRMSRPRSREPLTWHETPDEIERLGAYCDRDVETECDADAHLPALSERERRVWVLDQTINDRGFAVDLPLVQAAHAAVLEAQKRADAQMWRLTNGALSRASQTKKLAEWVTARGVPCVSVADEEIDDLIVTADMLDDQAIIDALQLRRNSAGAFKFEAMLRAACSDGRIRGCLQYHGTHGGRWAGRVVQPHNFKRIDSDEEAAQVAVMLDLLRRYGLDSGRLLDAAEMVLDMPALEVLTLCARPMIVARPGHKLVDADFSNIEGRINAWFAGATLKLDAFRAFDTIIPGEFDKDGKPKRKGPDLYVVTASDVTGIPIEQIRKEHRQESGKVPELSCGFQGAVNALLKQAAKIGLNLSPGRAAEIVRGWRTSPLNEPIVESWAELQQAAIEAASHPGMIVPALGDKVRYVSNGEFLFCRLPSGRVISYAAPKVGWSTKRFSADGKMIPPDEWREMDAGARADVDERNTFGVTFWGQKSGRWLKHDLYGGMQCAHIVSGTARDLLVETMFAVEAAGYPLVLTVHDEKLTEVPEGFGSADHFKSIIAAAQPEWLPGLPVAISTWEDISYVK